jgi:hypothetical protein
MSTYVAAKHIREGDTVVGRGNVTATVEKNRNFVIYFSGFPHLDIAPSVDTFSPSEALDRVDTAKYRS